MGTVTVLGLLGLCSIEDIFEKKLHIWVLGTFAIGGLCMHIIYPTLSMKDILGGISVGAFLLLINCMTRGKIGTGDGILLIVTGIYLGFWHNLMLLWGAAFLAGIFGIIMITVCKKDKDTEIPFAPFVLLAYIIISFVGS